MEKSIEKKTNRNIVISDNFKKKFGNFLTWTILGKFKIVGQALTPPLPFVPDLKL